jgi:hypothetical protein
LWSGQGFVEIFGPRGFTFIRGARHDYEEGVEEAAARKEGSEEEREEEALPAKDECGS